MRGTKRSRPWLPRPCRTQWDAVAEDASEDEAAATIEEEEAAEDEEQADVTAAQARGRKSSNSSKFGKPAEAGIIKEVYVYV